MPIITVYRLLVTGEMNRKSSQQYTQVKTLNKTNNHNWRYAMI